MATAPAGFGSIGQTTAAKLSALWCRSDASCFGNCWIKEGTLVQIWLPPQPAGFGEDVPGI